MAISNISNTNAYSYEASKNKEAINFGSLTAKTPAYPVDSYHQAYAEKSIFQTQPAGYSFIPATSDMEEADKYIKLKAAGLDNPISTVKATEKAYRPTNNGELSPVIAGREDEIEDCPWNPYYA